MINNIWIIKDSGQNLYTRTFTTGESGLDENLITGLFMAVASFAESAGKDEMDSIGMKNKKFLFQNKGEILIVIGTGKDVDEKPLFQQLNLIGDLFLEEFKDVLIDWDGNVAPFKRFKDVLDKELTKDSADVEQESKEPEEELIKVEKGILDESRDVSNEFPTEILENNPAHIKVFLSKSITEHYTLEIDFRKFPEKPIVFFGEILKVLGENPSLILDNWNADNPPKICEFVREIESYLLGPQLGLM